MAQRRGGGATYQGQVFLTTKPVSVAKPANTAADVTCSLCLDQLKEPKLLPCLHSFCKACLEGLVRKTRTKGKIACPQCRCTHCVPKNGVDGFPSDLVASHTLAFAKEFQQPITQSTKPVLCSMCTEGDPAANHCPACSRFLCEFCTRNHRRQVDYRTHRLVPVDKVDAEALKAFERPQYCTHHQGEMLKLYCSTCHQLICRDCTIVAHRDHSFGFTSSLRPKAEQEIRDMAKGITTKQKEFEAHLAFISTAEKSRSDHSADLAKEINAAFDAFIRLVEQQRQKLLQQEENAKTADLKRIWGQKQFIEVTLAGFASGLRYADRLCSCTNDQDMLAMSHKVRQQLSALHRETWSPDSTFQCSNLFTFTGPTNGQQVAKSIGSLNSVQSSQFSLSLQPLTLRPPLALQLGTSQINLALRKNVEFEVKVTNLPKVAHLVTPSVSVTDNYTNRRLDYVHNLVYDQRRKLWLLTVTPTCPGLFHVSVFVSSQQDSGVAQPGTLHGQLYAYGKVTSSGLAGILNFHQQSLLRTNVYTISVTGDLIPGDRVRRGPGWQGGDEDGGEGSEGVVIECDSKPGLFSAPPSFNTPMVSVRWTNGNTAQYWFAFWQRQSCPIELLPNYF